MTEEIIELEITSEWCCDRCQEIVHNHFDCPICKMEFAPSNVYGDLEYEDDVDTEISCQNCNSTFERVSEKWYQDCKVKIIKDGRKNIQ